MIAEYSTAKKGAFSRCLFMVLVLVMHPIIICCSEAADDVTPPTIKFVTPSEDYQVIHFASSSTTTSNVLVSGTVSDESGVSKFRLGGLVEYPILLGCNSSGTNWVCYFSQIFTVELGTNTFTARATDINSNVAVEVVHVVCVPPPPGPFFNASPTSGEAPLTVTFTDSSSGDMTNRVADFGDGTTISYDGPDSGLIVSNHTYLNAGLYTCSLTASGPGGSRTLTRTNYIRVVNPLAITNAFAVINGQPIVLPNKEVAFTIRETDLQGRSLSCLWSFGDGQTSTDSCPSHLFTTCGAHVVNVTASNAYSQISTSLVVSVACPFTELPKPTKLQLKSNFVPGKVDQATLKATFELPPLPFSRTNVWATVDIGGVSLDFWINAKGIGTNGLNKVTLKANAKTGLATLQVKLKGDFESAWAEYGLTNATVISQPVTVPVLLMFDSDPVESFYVNKPLLYKATANKSGSAK
jgi:PKD repeat protein